VKLSGKTVLADKAFCSQQIRAFIQSQAATACIPDKANAITNHNFNSELYKARNIIERFFLRIKTRRHIATRFDKLALCFANFVILASIMLLL
jgi:transposase